MKVVSALALVGASIVVVLVGFSMLGCESAQGIEGLTVTPAQVDLDLITNSVTFTASASSTTATNGTTTATGTVNLPVEWSVSDKSLGSIVRSSGATALYMRTTASGYNIITARDQAGNEGYATVHQP